MSNELSIPKVVQQDPSAIEILRVWEGEKITVRLQNGKESDPAGWGILLVDIARHYAKFRETQSIPASKILSRIKEGFDAEWTSPTDSPTQID